MRFLLAFILTLSSSVVIGQDGPITTGLIEPCPEELDRYTAPGAVFSPKMLNPPKSSSLIKYIPVIGDQGVQGACTAFSVSAAITILENQRQKRTFYDTKTLNYSYWYSPAFIFNIAKAKYPVSRSENCLDGISYIDAFSVVKQYGAALHSLIPYNPSGNSGCQSKYYPKISVQKAAQKRTIATFQRVERDLAQMKSLLADDPGYPICISVYIDKGYEAASEGRNNFIWSKKGTPIPGQINNRHAMVIVGYDDSISCFRVLDSKGVLKGDKGFLWLSYDLLASNVIYDSYVCSLDDRILRAQKTTGESDLALEEGQTSESWIKENFFRSFNGFRIGVLKIDKENKRVTYRISNHYTGEILLNDITIVNDQMKIFELRGKTFTIFQKDITSSKGNPFKAASIFDISFKGENVTKQFFSLGVSEENIRGLAKMTFLSKFTKSEIDKYIYQDPVTNIPMGSILSQDRNVIFSPSPDLEKQITLSGSEANTSFIDNPLTDLFSFYSFLENVKAPMDDTLRIWLERHDSFKIINWKFQQDWLQIQHLLKSEIDTVSGKVYYPEPVSPYLARFFNKSKEGTNLLVTQKMVLKNVKGKMSIDNSINADIRARLILGVHLLCKNSIGSVDLKLNQQTNELIIDINGEFPIFSKVEPFKKAIF